MSPTVSNNDISNTTLPANANNTFAEHPAPNGTVNESLNLNNAIIADTAIESQCNTANMLSQKLTIVETDSGEASLSDLSNSPTIASDQCEETIFFSSCSDGSDACDESETVVSFAK